MISNLRISVAELVVWALLAAAGLTWISFRVVDGAAWLMDWLRDRHEPTSYDPDPDDWIDPDADDDPLELPPERTWEQMTSHQLPLEPQPGYLIRSRVTAKCFHPPGSVPGCPWCSDEARERRPAAWEADHRAHYVAMGFDYPSGLMARVRELTS